MLIRAAHDDDRKGILEILEPVIRAGETYALPREMSPADAIAYWFSAGSEVLVAEDEGIVGTYFLRPNQRGGGAHVANCAYITAERAAGRGVGRAMCEHSLGRAGELGYRAIQFNFVVSTNERAVWLWKSFGFEIVGRLPGAFFHPTQGYVEALIMYLELEREKKASCPHI